MSETSDKPCFAMKRTGLWFIYMYLPVLRAMKKPDSGLIYVHIAISFNRNILDMWNDQEIDDFFFRYYFKNLTVIISLLQSGLEHWNQRDTSLIHGFSIWMLLAVIYLLKP